jgi:hypothetical protein
LVRLSSAAVGVPVDGEWIELEVLTSAFGWYRRLPGLALRAATRDPKRQRGKLKLPTGTSKTGPTSSEIVCECAPYIGAVQLTRVWVPFKTPWFA